MSSRAIFFLSRDGYEAAWQCLSLALTATAMGEDVTIVLAFDALRALAGGHFGKPLTERERAELTRGEGIGAPLPVRMLADARALGARVLACDTTVRLCGLTPSELEAEHVVDEVVGLPQIWRLASQARAVSF